MQFENAFQAAIYEVAFEIGCKVIILKWKTIPLASGH